MFNLKKKITNFIKGAALSLAVVSLFVNANTVYADGIDMITSGFVVASDSDSSWDSSVDNLSLNERAYFIFYFQNAGNIPAENVTLKLDMPEDSSSFDVGVSVSSDSPLNGSSASGSASDNVSVSLSEDNFRLFFDSGTAVVKGDFNGDGNIEEKSLGSDFRSNSGVNIGSVVGGKTITVEFEGYVVASGDPVLDVVFRGKNSSSGSDYGSALSASDSDTVKFLLELHNTVVGTHAEGVSFKIDAPTGYQKEYKISATASSTNAGSDNGEVVITFPEDTYKMVYVDDSLRISWDFDGDGTNDWDNAGLNDSNLFTSGVSLPDERDLLGCTNYIAYVTFEMQVHKKEVEKEKNPDIWVDKYVSDNDGDYKDHWVKSDFKAGDKVYFKIEFGNKGDGDGENVVLYDELPKYLKYVSGDGDYDKPSNTLEFDIGKLEAGKTDEVKFVAKVRDDIKTGCYINKAEIKEKGSEKDKDTAQVCMEKEGEVLGKEAPERLPETGSDRSTALLISFLLAVSGIVTRKLES